MKRYKLKVVPEAIEEIQKQADYYNRKAEGLGSRFRKATIKQIDSLNKDPHIYAIRYSQIRCMLIRKFPYMVHFFVNEKTRVVEVLGSGDLGRKNS
jgi:hypothetical protein